MVNKKFIKNSFIYHFRYFFKYRSNVFFSFFSELAIPLTINIMFIVGLTRNTLNVKRIVETVAYIILANITYTISVTNLENRISADIRSSKLVFKLLEPVSPCVNYIVSDLSLKILRILIFYFPGLILLRLFGQIDYVKIIYALPFILIANVTGYCLSFIIGCLSFWFTEIWGISAIKGLIIAVFAGTIFPFSLLSEKVQSILFITPFPYLSYIPSATILGWIDKSEFLFLLLVGLIWCILLSITAAGVWTIGKKKYESVGV